METEDISMKFIKTTILSGCFFLILTLLGAGEKPVEKNHFLSVNPNINNKEMKNEFKVLKQDFDLENLKIQNYYTNEIERLIEERRLQVKNLKKKFGEKRDILLQKYGEEHKLKSPKPDRLNQQDKKPIRKPK